MSQPAQLYLYHRRPRHGFWWHFAQLSAMVLSFLVISAVALFYSLGYQINWQARSIEQTGSIYVNIRNDVPANVYVNGQLQPDTQPLNVEHLFPGQYSVQVQAQGYQSFSEIMQVRANTVTAVHNLVLIRTEPQPTAVESSWLPLSVPAADPNVQVKRQDELWVSKKFVTRTSGNIIQAQYYPDDRHVIYQEDGALWLIDLESQTVESLVDNVGDKPVPFAFEEGGQILVYQVGNAQPKAVSLY